MANVILIYQGGSISTFALESGDDTFLQAGFDFAALGAIGYGRPELV